VSSADIMLVGDIGGTHARFATVDVSASAPWRLENRQDFAVEIPTFEQALQRYVEAAGLAGVPPSAAVAVAGPVTAGQARLTNRDWLISEEALRRFGCHEALLINDFIALAFAVEILGEADLHLLGPDLKGIADEPITILGAGTGFGVSCLARYRNRLVVPMATEGGHIAFAPGDEQEIAVLRQMMRRYGRVSVERILSGPGLEALYQALEEISGRTPAQLSAAQVTTQAVAGDPGCAAALTMFCAVYGSVAGDLALAHGARGGVYIAGGIALKIETFLAKSAFRSRFESKGRLSPFVRAIPTKIITSGDAALLGSAHAGVSLRAHPSTPRQAGPR
jgi:glucokinase